MVDLKGECMFAAENEQNRVYNPSTSSSSSSSSQAVEAKKSCTGCNTTTTPLWRGGPAGPKTLCNACGIKYRKKRRAMMGIESGKPEKAKLSNKSKKPKSGGAGVSKSLDSSGEMKSNPLGATPKIKTALKKFSSRNGSGVGFERSLIWRKLGEEEQAAMLLMALSCGSVYA